MEVTVGSPYILQFYDSEDPITNEGALFRRLNQIHSAALMIVSSTIRGQNSGEIPLTSPIFENSRYVATIDENRVVAQGMANRQGVISTTFFAW